MKFSVRRFILALMKERKRLVTWSVRVDDTLDAAMKRLAEKDLRTVSNDVEMVVRRHVADIGIEVVPEPREVKSAKRAEK